MYLDDVTNVEQTLHLWWFYLRSLNEVGVFHVVDVCYSYAMADLFILSHLTNRLRKVLLFKLC